MKVPFSTEHTVILLRLLGNWYLNALIYALRISFTCGIMTI